MHSLSQLNQESATAVCSECGPVDIRPKGQGRWRCGNKTRENHRRQDKTRNARRRAAKHFGKPLEELAEAKSKFMNEQGGKCAICRKSVTEETSRLDHCHETGILRGVLCNGCNLGLGLLGDSVESVERALEYLRPLQA